MLGADRPRRAAPGTVTTMHVRQFQPSDGSALASIFHSFVREGGLKGTSPCKPLADLVP